MTVQLASESVEDLMATPDDSEEGRSKRRRRKEVTPEKAAIQEILGAVKNGDQEAGWQAFERSVAADIQLSVQVLTPLLFLFTGLDNWIDRLRLPIPNFPEPAPRGPLPPLNLDRAKAVLEHVVAKGGGADENLRAIQARVCALQGDGVGALRMADDCFQAMPTRTRLRTYLPALLVFAKQGNLARCLEVQQRMLTNVVGADLGVMEYTPLLQACCSHGSHAQVERLLEQIGVDLAELPDSMLQIVHNYFSSYCAAQGTRGWELSWVDVDPQGSGHVEWAGDSLQMKALSPPDWAEFQAGLLEMASTKEKSAGSFQEFVDWLEGNPAQIFLDGANIALFGQSCAMDRPGGGFSWSQIAKVLGKVEQQFGDKKAVVVLHVGRMNAGVSRKPDAQRIIHRLKERKQLFVTPKGSNDDWYWLYGVVKAGEAGILVSNDEMRDHIFELLRPRFFLKWKAHHRCKYVVGPSEGSRRVDTELIPPPRFTTCVQRLPNGAWMLPSSPTKWLCARLREPPQYKGDGHKLSISLAR